MTIGLNDDEKVVLAGGFAKLVVPVVLWASAAGATVAPNADHGFHDDVSGRTMDVQRFSTLGLLIEYDTPGDETKIQVQVWGSIDLGDTFFPIAGNDAIASGVIRSRVEQIELFKADHGATGGNLNMISVAHLTTIKVKVAAPDGTPTGKVRVKAIGGIPS